VTATAAEVEQLINKLAGFRQRMKPEVPRTLPDGQLSGEVDPIWAMPSHPKAPDKVLMIRHFGMGWLSFFFPASSAQKLGNALLLGQASPQMTAQPEPTRPRQ
jgi:hypothetical protein